MTDVSTDGLVARDISHWVKWDDSELLDQAACACQHPAMIDDAIVRDAVALNIIAPFRQALAALERRNAEQTKVIVALADGADKCAEAPHFIVQPFLAIYRKHGETIAEARKALSHSSETGCD